MIAVVALIIELGLLTAITSTGIRNVGDVTATLLIILFSLLFVPAVQNGKHTYKYFQQLFLGYLFRLAILLFDYFGNDIYTLPQSGDDARMFYRTSSELVLYGKTNRSGSFITLMYNVMRYIGLNRLYAQFLLMLLSIAALVIFLNTIDDFDIGQVSKDRTAWVLCLLPHFALLSSLFLRESLVTLLVSISACAMVKWMRNEGSLFFVLAMFFSVIACLFHDGSIGITIGCILCLLIYDRRSKHIHVTLGGLTFAIVVAVGASFVFLKYGDALLTKIGTVDSIDDISNTSSLGGSSYARYVGNSNNPLNMIVYSLPRIVYFLFSPFPWQWRGIGDIIAFFFSGLYYLLTIRYAIRYLWQRNQDNRSMVLGLLAVVFFCTFIFAWGTANTGTASRHRDKMVLIYGLIFALTQGRTDLFDDRSFSQSGIGLKYIR